MKKFFVGKIFLLAVSAGLFLFFQPQTTKAASISCDWGRLLCDTTNNGRNDPPYCPYVKENTVCGCSGNDIPSCVAVPTTRGTYCNWREARPDPAVCTSNTGNNCVCLPGPVCGNGVVDSGEACDTGISYGNQACGNGACAGGTQTKTCNNTCSGFNYGSCSTTGNVCAPGDQCNDPGLCGSNGNCNPATPKTNGTACNDGDACTSPDTCTFGGFNSTCSGPNICSGVVNGSCGTANKTYASSATTFGSDTFCATGTATSFNPNSSFPASGSAITWVCQGSGGGASPTCSASRASASVNDPSGTDSSSGACERASTWWSRNGAAAYNLYRNTVNNSGTATKILSNIAYTDPSFGGYIDTVAAGTYYYWVQNVGSANLIASAQNTRVPPGLTVPACPCTFSISPSANNFSSAGGSGTVTVTASYCAWTATPNVAWLHVTSGTPGNGPGTVVYTVDSYTGPGVRSGTITIAGQTFTVTQDPPTIGDPYGVDGSSGACERASTFWFRNGAAAYNLYRNTSNNSGTATKILSNVAYTDPTYGGYIDTVTAGTYYYWVQNVGSANLIASAKNSVGGLVVPACPCTFSINPTSRTFTSAGGSDNVLITASGPSCVWNSNVNNSWLNIISSTSGIGNGSITYTAASYPGPGQRTGTMTIAGQTYTVTQNPPIVNGSCGSASRTYPYADTTFGSDNFCDTGTPINFNPNSNFPAAGSSISWVCDGSGGGSPSGTCTATRQAAPSCNYSLSPTFNNFPPAGGSSTFTVSTGAACSWTASPNNSWLHIVAGANGTATGTVAYTVDAYAGATVRTGTITAGGQTFTVTQDPPSGPGGPPAGSVHVYNSATDPSNGRTACQRVTVVWTDNSTDETGFKIFKDGSLLTTRSASSPASQTGSVMSYTFDPGDNATHNYAVASTNAIGDSAQVNATENPLAALTCGSPPGGPPAGSVHVYNSATDAVVGRTACQRVTVVWTDNSTDETGFKIFKDGSLLTTRSASIPASQTGSVMSYTFDPGDTNSHNYAVASTNAIGDSAQVNATENPTAAIVCGGNLGSSDKNIVALNGNNLYSGLPYGSQCDSVTDALPANTSFKIGDKLKFAINLCNTGQGAASNISVTDTMINLIKPSTLSDFNAYWGATKLTYDGDQAPGYTAQANHYFTYNTTAIPNQTIKFVLNGSVAVGTSPALTFEAQTSVPASFTGAIARLQNGFNISYNNGSIQTTLPSARYTPLIQFYTGAKVPIVKEIP